MSSQEQHGDVKCMKNPKIFQFFLVSLLGSLTARSLRAHLHELREQLQNKQEKKQV
jgi:hypothetical protein